MKKIFFLLSSLLLLLGAFFLGKMLYEKKKEFYLAEDFGITVIKSSVDYNHNGIDDYTDILLGAKEEAKRAPKYKNAYYAGGYPPDNEGVCTDVIWRAFQKAGYNLKEMVDEDIKENIEAYPRVEGTPDPNIDFRRVGNLKTFFERKAKSLTTDLKKIEEWQPGDIVTFGISHIGIISDKRNKKGIPYLIHNSGQPLREEDALEFNNSVDKISGHFRYEVTLTGFNTIPE